MRLSRNFDDREFACRHCGVVKVAPHLVEHLEKLRTIVGRPLVIVSGYRCPVHNANVGGRPSSIHLLGGAADIEHGYATLVQAERAGFTGIGTRGHWVRHVDVRPRRARWTYT